MHAKKFDTWTEFLDHIRSVDGFFTQEQQLVLYRGQSDANRPLKTTLERRVNDDAIRMKDYVKMALRHRGEIASTTGAVKPPPDPDEEIEKLELKYKSGDYGYLPAYEYLVYLRQHGFASPLLDWTRSPYVALFFAYTTPPQPGVDEVSIFVLSELPGADNSEIVKVHRPDVTTHRRHFAQQSWYTTASYFDQRNTKDLVFVSHENAMEQKGSKRYVAKFTLPVKVREDCLRWLAVANVNDYTLFQTEDSLIRAIDSRVFDIDWRKPRIVLQEGV